MDSKPAAAAAVPNQIDVTRKTVADYQSDRNQPFALGEYGNLRTNYSAFRRWEQRLREWSNDVDVIRRWSLHQKRITSGPPPPVSFLAAATCEVDRTTACSHEICCRLRSYRAAVEDVKASLEPRAIDIESEEHKADDDEAPPPAKLRKLQPTAVSAVIVKEAEEMLAIAQTILDQFNKILLTIWDIGTYQNNENLTSFDSNPIATNAGKLSFADLVRQSTTLDGTAVGGVGDKGITSHGTTTNSAATTRTPAKNPLLLHHFQAFLRDLFRSAQEIDQTDETCEEKLQQTATLILEWNPANQILPPNTVSYIPSAAVENPHLSKMILYAIIFKTATILGKDVGLTCDQRAGLIRDDNNSTMSTPPIQVVVNHVAQRLTEVVSKVQYVPAKVETLVEMSSTTVPDTNVKILLSTLADSFFEALQFGGVGVNRKYRGAIVTMVSVEILELELEHVGTTNAILHFRRSGLYPLLDEETTGLILKASNNNTESATQFKDILVDNDPTKGLEILASLISYSDFERSGASDGKIELVNTSDAEAVELLGLVGYLGARKHHNLYKLPKEKSYLKVPKTHEFARLLQRELKTLRALDHPCIAKISAQGIDQLKVRIRCETSELQCLRMEGLVGAAATGFYFRDLGALTYVYERVVDALDHAHSRRIVHLNVSPITISVRQVTEDAIQVQLDDWGDAADMDTPRQSFSGPYLFAHSDLCRLGVQLWKPVAEHDLASVAHTMASLVTRFELRRHPATDPILDRNQTTAIEENLRKLGIDSECRTKLMNSMLPIYDESLPLPDFRYLYGGGRYLYGGGGAFEGPFG